MQYYLLIDLHRLSCHCLQILKLNFRKGIKHSAFQTKKHQTTQDTAPERASVTLSKKYKQP